MAHKIVELQGLRCIAIVSVLLYHVWPDVFVNGFLGVDIFFVISGYFMARILLSSDSLKTSFLFTTLTFYHRRIYRILPLYLLNIFITLLIVPGISYSASVGGIFSQVIDVLTFRKNFINISKFRNYFDHSLSIDMFTHYWSLCVEMQFYAIVPFLLYLAKWLPLLVNLYILWPMAIIASVAFSVYQLSTFGVFGATYIFFMLPTRFYEFVAGFIAFYGQEFVIKYFSDGKLKLEIRRYFHHVITVNFLTLILIGIVFWPIQHDEEVPILITILSTAIAVVFASAIIMFIGKGVKSKAELEYSILAHEPFVFIGNASYSLYIFHWIFIIFFKVTMEETEYNRQIIFILSFITGCLIHKYVEKPICNARLPWKISLICIAAAYAFLCLFAYTGDHYRTTSDHAKDLFYTKSQLIGDRLEWEKISSSITPDISAELGIYAGEKNCFHYPRSGWSKTIPGGFTYGAEFNNGTGNLSVLIIGNSHAECHTPGIKLAMEGLYANLSFVGIAGVTPFEGFEKSGAWFVFKNAVEHYKPDVIFLIFKYQQDFEDPLTDTDFHTMKVQEMITFLSKSSKVVFISGPQAQFDSPKFFSIKFTELVYYHGWVKDFRVSQKKIEEKHAVSTKRWNGIKCENCIFIDRLKAYCKNGWCSPLDEGRSVPLFFDNDHVTIFGSNLLSKYIKEYFDRMFQLLIDSKQN